MTLTQVMCTFVCGASVAVGCQGARDVLPQGRKCCYRLPGDLGVCALLAPWVVQEQHAEPVCHMQHPLSNTMIVNSCIRISAVLTGLFAPLVLSHYKHCQPLTPQLTAVLRPLSTAVQMAVCL